MQKAAEQGDADAQTGLALLVLRQCQCAKDDRSLPGTTRADRVRRGTIEVGKWLLKAAQQEHALAQFHLGAFLWTERDKPLEAEQWLKKAANQGDRNARVKAHRVLGELYQHAESLKNPALEAKFLRVAAEAGNASAQSRLGALLAPEPAGVETPEALKDTQV